MLRIGICDDSAEARLGLRAMLERLLDKRAVECQIYEFSSGEGLLGWMEKHTGEIDLVFLDIEMGGLNGMEAAKALRERSDALQLVFVTGYTDFVFDGYAVGALGYVMKPPQPEQIGDVLTPKKSIRYFYSDRRQVTCVTDTRRLTFYARLDDVAEAVGAAFVRIHQRYLVRAGAVDRVEGGTVVIGEEKLPISRSCQPTALAAIARAMLE